MARLFRPAACLCEEAEPPPGGVGDPPGPLDLPAPAPPPPPGRQTLLLGLGFTGIPLAAMATIALLRMLGWIELSDSWFEFLLRFNIYLATGLVFVGIFVLTGGEVFLGEKLLRALAWCLRSSDAPAEENEGASRVTGGIGAFLLGIIVAALLPKPSSVGSPSRTEPFAVESRPEAVRVVAFEGATQFDLAEADLQDVALVGAFPEPLESADDPPGRMLRIDELDGPGVGYLALQPSADSRRILMRPVSITRLPRLEAPATIEPTELVLGGRQHIVIPRLLSFPFENAASAPAGDSDSLPLNVERFLTGTFAQQLGLSFDQAAAHLRDYRLELTRVEAAPPLQADTTNVSSTLFRFGLPPGGGPAAGVTLRLHLQSTRPTAPAPWNLVVPWPITFREWVTADQTALVKARERHAGVLQSLVAHSLDIRLTHLRSLVGLKDLKPGQASSAPAVATNRNASPTLGALAVRLSSNRSDSPPEFMLLRRPTDRTDNLPEHNLLNAANLNERFNLATHDIDATKHVQAIYQLAYIQPAQPDQTSLLILQLTSDQANAAAPVLAPKHLRRLIHWCTGSGSAEPGLDSATIRSALCFFVERPPAELRDCMLVLNQPPRDSLGSSLVALSTANTRN